MKQLIAFIISSLVLLANLYAKEPFVWYDDEDYHPYIYRDKNGKIDGLFK